MSAPAELVGRTSERDAVLRVLEGRRPGAVVLSGPAGVGKTRLARHCADHLADRGVHVVHVAASATMRDLPLGALTRLLPDDRPIPERGVDALRVVADGIRRTAPSPSLLSIDDAHDLDEQSAWVVRDLVTNGDVSLLATVRSGEPCPGEVVDLWRSGTATRVDLDAFDRSVAGAFAEQVLGGPIHPTLHERAWTISAGNALYLRELLLGAAHSGAVELVDGAWAATGELSSSERLADVVERRLQDLDADHRAGLEVVAVAGSIGTAVVERLVPGAVLVELERRGHLRADIDRRRSMVSLSHPLPGEVLRAGMPTSRYRQVCRGLASALAGTGARRRGDALRLATWQLEGGAVDPDLFTVAADAARFAGDHRLAERLARTAWEHGRAFDALTVLIAVLGFQGRPEEAVEWAGRVDVSELAEGQRTRLEILRAETLFWGLGRADDARAVLRDALDAVRHPDRRNEMLAARAAYDMLAGRLDDALATTYELATGDSARTVAATALSSAGSLVLTGRAVEAWEIAQRGIDARLEQEDSPLTLEFGLLVVAQIMAGTASGRFADAIALGETAHAIAVEANTPLGQGFLGMLHGRCLLVQGRVGEADRWLRDAHLQFGLGGYDGAQRWCVGARVFCQAYLGRGDDARELVRVSERYDPGELMMMEPEMRRGQAWALAASGEWQRARAVFDDAIAMATRQRMLTHEISARHDLVRLGWADRGDVDALADAAAQAQGPLAAQHAAHGRALVADDPDHLHRVALAYTDMTAYLFAAEAAAQAVVSARQQGASSVAADAASVLAWAKKHCGEVETPTLTSATGDLWRLTEREREVAEHAAGGTPTRQIAERLFVSPRTIENHLHRVYAKLGIGGRAELASLIRPTTTD